MESYQILDIFAQGLMLAMTIITVLVLPGIIVGLVVAMFQAATQINETSLSFVPKLLVTLMAIALTAPWIHNMIIDFTTTLYNEIPYFIG